MFRFFGYILVSVAKVLDLTSSTIDLVLRPLSRYDNLQSSTSPVHGIPSSLGSRHDGRGGRVISKEDEYHSCEADGSRNTQHACKTSPAYLDSQHRLLDGYNEQAEHVRSSEFKRLGSKVYVDHAGATLYSEKQLKNAYKDLEGKLYTNPHSGHAAWGSDISAMDCEAEARALTLAMCHAKAEDYECIFTSGATGAMRLVAEAFPWSEQSTFAYTLDNHNSVVGMRGCALEYQASAVAVHITSPNTKGPLCLERCGPPMQQHAIVQSSRFSGPVNSDPSSSQHPPATHSLFAYPLESNFSGARYGLEVIQHLQQQGVELQPGHDGQSGQRQGREHWHVFLDAAKACGSSPPDLRQAAADFVALSYYKIFGYPTGLGALLVRKDALKHLRKRYFGGGAVSVSIADRDFYRQRPGAAGFEDGTPAYLGIAALKHGFAQIERLGSFAAIEHHTASLTRYLAEALTDMRHANGSTVCELYGAHAIALGTWVGGESMQHKSRECLPGAVGQGPIVAFNLFRSCGAYVGYREVEKLAGLAGIMLRTGCFCNPGACQAHLGLSHEDVIRNYEAGHVCWDERDIIDGRPTGAVRVSFGYISTLSDAQAVVSFVEQYFVDEVSPHQQADDVLVNGTAEDIPKGSVPHQLNEAALHSTEHSSAEAARSDSFLGSQPSMTPSTGQSGSDADEAVLDQSHHIHLASDGGSFRTASGEGASSPVASSSADKAAVTGLHLAAEARTEGHVKLESIWVYPIKSCAGFAPSSWPLGLNGLLYDREWAIVDVDGEALTQKRLPKLATIRPALDLEKGVMTVTCPSMPDPVTITLPEATSHSSVGCEASTTATLVNGSVAQDPHRLAKSLPASLQPTPAKAPGRARPGSSAPARSTDAQDSDVGSIAGSAVSQSDSCTSHGSRHHLNPALWPRQTPLEPKRSSSGFLRTRSSQAPMSRSGSAAEPNCTSGGSRGGRGMGSLDVRSVRERFRHLHSAASLGGASQQSMPSRASIDAYSSPVDASPWNGQSKQLPQPQGAPASEASILQDFRQSREASPRLGQGRQLPHPQGTPVSEASILEDFRQHREALAEASPRLGLEDRLLPQPQGSPDSKASALQDVTQRRETVQAGSSSGLPALSMTMSEQDGWDGRETAQQTATSQAKAGGDSAAAAEGTATQGNHVSLQRQIQVCSSRVCGLQVGTREVQEAVSDWFTQALGLKCWLVQQQAGSRQAVDREQLAAGVPSPAQSSLPEAALEPLDALQSRSIGFANEGQFLAISAASLQDVNRRVQEAALAKKREPVQVSPERFRPNLVFSGAMQPYVEDTWQHLSIGRVPFRVTGQCARCEMVCTDQEAGKRGGPEPLLTLAAYRRTRGRIHFGVLLDHAPAAGPVELLEVGDVVDVRPSA